MYLYPIFGNNQNPMLEPDFNTKWKEAIYLKIEGGSFICNSIYEGETLLFDSASGRLTNIYADYRRFKSGVFRYWHIELTDNENGNIYLICFPYTSALFQSVILKLAMAATYNDIRITPYRDDVNANYIRRNHSKVKVYADGMELDMQPLKMPKIDCRKLGNHIIKDYTPRIRAIEGVIGKILARIRKSSTQARKQPK